MSFSHCSRIAFATLLVASCTRQHPQSTRLAILRFENLGSDTSYDWLGRAFTEIFESELAATNTVLNFSPRARIAPGISAERAQAFAAGATHMLYGRFSVEGGNLRLDVTEEELATQKMIRQTSATGSASDPVNVADSIVHGLASNTRPYGTHNTQALHAYTDALEAQDAVSAAQALDRALAADPNFGAAYVAKSRIALSTNDRGTALRVLDQARTAQANSTDPRVLRSLADADYAARRFSVAAEFYNKALALQPNSPELLNLLGYSQGYAGDLEGAVKSLRAYERVAPNDFNPLDSLGDVHYYNNRFAEAEKFYLQSYEKDPKRLGGGELLKAAHARLMVGDAAGANDIFRKYSGGLMAANDPLAALREAEWEFLTGKRAEAIARAEAFWKAQPPQSKDVRSRAAAQIAIWHMDIGEREKANPWANAALSEATPVTAPLAAIARFIAEPPASAAEWATRATRVFVNPAQQQLKEFALAHALLYSKEFAAAVPLLRKLYEASIPETQEGLPVLLGWALTESGKKAEAAPLLKSTPLPQAAGLSPFESLWFPRLRQLRPS